MKNILRNNLWMMIVAWCLEIQGHVAMALVICLFSSIYLIMNARYISLLKALIIAMIFMVYCYLLASVTVIGEYPHFVLFLGLVSLNEGITNEFLQRERLNCLYRVFVFALSSYIIFFMVTLFIPDNLIFEVVRLNTLTLIMIIFLPYTSLMLVRIIQKEYQKKLLLDKIERISKARKLNIR